MCVIEHNINCNRKKSNTNPNKNRDSLEKTFGIKIKLFSAVYCWLLNVCYTYDEPKVCCQLNHICCCYSLWLITMSMKI